MAAKTGAEKVLDELRKTLLKANRQARAKQTISHDRMVSMAKLTNAYVKLLNVAGEGVKKEETLDPMEYGDPTFYDSLCNKTK